jgi:preprotein translocase subunit SecA
MMKLFSGFGDSNERELKRLQPLIDRINGLEPDFERLSDEELRAKTGEFKARLKDGAALDELLPEAFAAVREAAKRTLGQRHYDEQLLGGIVLHQGKISEMKTGEGKTLVATLPLYLNALTGKGCHLVTVNDYLARRDPYWMGPVYHALGVSVASIYPMQSPDERTPARLYDPDYDSQREHDPWRHFRSIPREEAYQADITYGTSSEFGFDYLRDNMVTDLRNCVQKELNYAIVDEVDNLLIDEARTPLIISGPDEEAGKLYPLFAHLVRSLKPGEDYTTDEKRRGIEEITEAGYENAERMLRRDGILKSGHLWDGDIEHARLKHHLENAILAKEFYQRDKEYAVRSGDKGAEVVIVDQFTGRLMLGRRYADGLHQAIEAKEQMRGERVAIQRETKTFATITIQNYFRMYGKLAGMTGTAVTEAEEFHKIYNLEVLVIPTHRPMVRQDHTDQIYKDEEAKFRAVVREIDELHKQGRPVLVGTVSIEKSEELSGLLTRKGIAHQVLNAKLHEKEAGIISEAGNPGAVTVATNMAGRGVDIVLGGKEPPRENQKEWQEWQKRHNQVIGAGGLHVLGTERHDARRIDNQLRGRSGRQGDPGSSRFYVSLEDDIVRRFGGERIKGFMERLGMDEDTPIENRFINKTIEDVQKRVEGYHFDIRKNLVEYDDVVNTQRAVIYDERRKILGEADLRTNILAMVNREIQTAVATYLPEDHVEDWDVAGLARELGTILPLPPELSADTLAQMEPREIEDKLAQHAEALYAAREQELGPDKVRVLERLVLLRILDRLWIDHLTDMDRLRHGAGWQSLMQVRSVDAYKRFGYEQFEELKDAYQRDVAHTVYHVTIKKREEPPKQVETPMAQVSPGGSPAPKKPLARVAGGKVGRNDPCPCGSGKKYKKCCGR